MPERFSLVFEGGARAGERVPVSGDRFTIGRKPGHSLVVSDASVSGNHCELKRNAEGWTLRDVGSTNGTFFGGAKILEVKLKAGDRFAIGSVLVRLEEGGGADEEIALPSPSQKDGLDFVEDTLADTEATTPAAAAAVAVRTAPAPPPDLSASTSGLSAPLVTDAATVERALKAAR